LERLVAEASEEELRAANRKLELHLQPEFLDFLPTDLLTNPLTPNYLLNNPAVVGSPLHQWKVDFRDYRHLPAHPLQEWFPLAQGLSVESWLDRLL